MIKKNIYTLFNGCENLQMSMKQICLNLSIHKSGKVGLSPPSLVIGLFLTDVSSMTAWTSK